MYKEKRQPKSEFVPIRGLNYHVQHWGPALPNANSAPPLVLLHGWMDVAASYQFMVDAFSNAFIEGRRVIAPDWRGFGQTEAGHADHFWFPDYVADLDFLLGHVCPDQPVDLVGHSMGGNVAMMYAGVRPKRIRRLVNLEGFGMPASKPSQAPGRYAQWMDELKNLHQGETALKSYADADGVAKRLVKTNPRLSADKAAWLATRWARPDTSGQWKIQGHAAHKVTSAHIYRLDEMLAIYQRITAPLLAVEADSDSLSKWSKGSYTLADYHQRLTHVANVRTAILQDAGHMLHHDQPEQLALLIENFLS